MSIDFLHLSSQARLLKSSTFYGTVEGQSQCRDSERLYHRVGLKFTGGSTMHEDKINSGRVDSQNVSASLPGGTAMEMVVVDNSMRGVAPAHMPKFTHGQMFHSPTVFQAQYASVAVESPTKPILFTYTDFPKTDFTPFSILIHPNSPSLPPLTPSHGNAPA